ncbi:DUF1015 domain-containing protein [Ruminococcus sp. NK3A76]|uniref:DUF1015 domain-containing protein n=1 Tax=Ruminococcus sp. NK3A76 TaxID=877411 RepID=UPI00048D01C9|nr:DUF1015 domain-containing protein [Ruminococcus sp. NK3A76]
MTAFRPADILLPANTDMEKWAVVACDQYTSEPGYWAELEQLIGAAPSALNLILPEVYLGSGNEQARIDTIHKNMEKYIADGIFTEYKDALIYIERVQDDGKVRAGLVGCIDLEEYDYSKGSSSPVRATEATVVERIPPRLKVRRGADIELTHIMILIDDGSGSVIEPLYAKKQGFEKLYDTPLLKKGGSITGWLLDEQSKADVLAALDKLGEKEGFEKRYGLTDTPVLLYAMGDGNHSLATAKAYYEELKAANPGKDMSNHPARYALCEIVNLHSPALEFEAIHRIVTGADENQLFADITNALGLTEGKTDGAQCFGIVNSGQTVWYTAANTSSKLTVGTLQNFLDTWCKENGAGIDYIHGTEVVEKLSMDNGSVGFILPDMGKNELFPTVIADGALPRKTFSMGHAWDKRYYIEARRITD